MKIYQKIQNRWKKLRFQPIRVFCFHQVTDKFDADSMWPCDWIQTDVFKHIAQHAVNPYDKQGTAQAIFDVISTYPLEGIINKHFYDL